MAKSDRRRAEMGEAKRRKEIRMANPGGQSKYALKCRRRHYQVYAAETDKQGG